MKLFFQSYNGKHRIVSLAKSEHSAKDLCDNMLDHIFIGNGNTVLFPEGVLLHPAAKMYDRLSACNDYDVFELYGDGHMIRVCNCASPENVFFITGVCNSNCIMCPSPVETRKSGNGERIDDLIEIAEHMPSDLSHITITGGEPFMAGKSIFRLLDYCRSKFYDTEFQILTNGRIFAVEEYVRLLCETVPENCVLGIPVHGSNAAIHDSVTLSPGSFMQTVRGIQNLLMSHKVSNRGRF